MKRVLWAAVIVAGLAVQVSAIHDVWVGARHQRSVSFYFDSLLQ